MNDFAYKKEPCPFPTRARGLFTVPNDAQDQAEGEGKWKIVARGYDKFFNVGEVAWTQLPHTACRFTEAYIPTVPPNTKIQRMHYLHLSPIPSNLLITSKHAIGTHRLDSPTTLTHAGTGALWLDRHLAQVGSSQADLAAELWSANVTAVAELCDDSFEEHVLPIPAQQTGLHLHGLNLNLPELRTYPPSVVNAFAEKYGLHPTPFLTVGSTEEVDRVCKDVETNGWNGDRVPVEGIVVRGSPARTSTTPKDDECAPGEAAFWKVKYDQPYLLYREWREITRRLIKSHNQLETTWNRQQSHDLPAILHGKISAPSADELVERKKEFLKEGLGQSGGVRKGSNPRTAVYVNWVTRDLVEGKRGPEWFEEWAKGRGVVSTREEFLEWEKANPGVNLGGAVEKGGKEDMGEKEWDRVVLVPVAAPGCGKTVLAQALQIYLARKHINMFHTQSDDVTSKRTGPGFLKNVREGLLEVSVAEASKEQAQKGRVKKGKGKGQPEPVDGVVNGAEPQSQPLGPRLVFADKNNHLASHRRGLVAVAEELGAGFSLSAGKKAKGQPEQKTKLKVRLVALVYDVPSLPPSDAHAVLSARILARGEHHQSLRPEILSTGEPAHEPILWRFLSDFEKFDPVDHPDSDGQFDAVCELQTADSVEGNLVRVLEFLRGLGEDVGDGGVVDTKCVEEAVIKALEVEKDRILVKKEMDPAAVGGKTGPRYYAVVLTPEVAGSFSLERWLERVLHVAHEEIAKKENGNLDTSLWHALVEGRRVTTNLHITLLHHADIKSTTDPTQLESKIKRWEHYSSTARSGTGDEVEIVLGPRVMWNDRVMAIEVESMGPEEMVRWGEGKGAHVTVGTRKEEIRPLEGKLLVVDVVKGKTKGVTVVTTERVRLRGTIKGLTS